MLNFKIMKYKLARYSSILFVIVLILAFTLKREEVFVVDTEVVFNEVLSGSNIANEEILGQVVDNNNSSLLIIDVRTPGEYIKGHIENAINIPVKNMLDPDYVKIYKHWAKPIIVYGVYTCDAQRAYMMIRQLGVDSISVIAGGYKYFTEFGDWVFPVESAKYEFAEIMKEKSGGKLVQPKAPVRRVIKKAVKQKERAEGGC